MTITFSKELRQRVWHLLRPQIADQTCPFCHVDITGKNFAGAAFIQGEFRAFDGNFICLLELTKID